MLRFHAIKTQPDFPGSVSLKVGLKDGIHEVAIYGEGHAMDVMSNP